MLKASYIALCCQQSFDQNYSRGDIAMRHTSTDPKNQNIYKDNNKSNLGEKVVIKKDFSEKEIRCLAWKFVFSIL